MACDEEDDTAVLKVRKLEEGSAYTPGTFDVDTYVEQVKGCPKTGVVAFMQLMKGRNREPWNSPWHVQFNVGTRSSMMRDFLMNIEVMPNDDKYWSFRRWNRRPATWGNPQGHF